MAEPGTVRPGGRTARTRAVAFEAALADLRARGYEQVSVETIAERAGVHKTTLYRRWRTKEQLVAEALESIADGLIEVPDTGDVDADLRALARGTLALLLDPDAVALLRALVTGAQSSPEIERIARRLWAVRLAQVTPIVERAVERGQLPEGTDAGEVIRQMAAPLYHRLLVTFDPLTESLADRSVAAVLAAARAGVFTGT
ncbi:TetR/AcrR family transcriptional regulator [Actinomadura scrupuli]|uniref:TetR/AcrR family transcriptional regulator n=1 Tax=Actinomadura scrupuli TaxID=559629 RepID=UPI003D98BDE3